MSAIRAFTDRIGGRFGSHQCKIAYFTSAADPLDIYSFCICLTQLTAGARMVSGEQGSTYLSVLETAETYFPSQKRLVQRLFYVNEPFHSMCEDLTAAAQALAHVERLPEPVREARRLEYAGLVDALLKEMGEAIAQSKIVVLRRSPQTGPKPL